MSTLIIGREVPAGGKFMKSTSMEDVFPTGSVMRQLKDYLSIDHEKGTNNRTGLSVE